VSLIATPVELIKCRQQVSFQTRLSGVEVVRQLLREKGPRGLYQGFAPTLLRSTVGNAAAFGTFETLQQLSWPAWLSGGLAGLMFWTISFPADVIKSRVQTGQGGGGWGAGYFRGFSAVVLRAFPTNAAAFATFSWCDANLRGKVAG